MFKDYEKFEMFGFVESVGVCGELMFKKNDFDVFYSEIIEGFVVVSEDEEFVVESFEEVCDICE